MALLQYLHVVFSLLIQTWMTSDLVDQSILFLSSFWIASLLDFILSRVRKKTTKFQISMLPINDGVDNLKFFDEWAPWNKIYNFKWRKRAARFHGLVVRTLDSESSNPSSNLGGTSLLHFVIHFLFKNLSAFFVSQPQFLLNT